MVEPTSPQRRAHRRLAVSLPIRAWGTDPAGRPFFADGATIDVSSGGVRFRVGSPPDGRRPLLVYIAPSPGSRVAAYRLRATLTVLRVEGPSRGESDWTVAGRFRPEDAEWLRTVLPDAGMG